MNMFCRDIPVELFIVTPAPINLVDIRLRALCALHVRQTKLVASFVGRHSANSKSDCLHDLLELSARTGRRRIAWAERNLHTVDIPQVIDEPQRELSVAHRSEERRVGK